MLKHPPEIRDIPNVQTSSEEIARKLTRRIFQQEFSSGMKLPSERDLAVQFGVARNVVREAIKRLEAIGVLRSWRGSGVYVQDINFIPGVDLFDTLITHEDGAVNIEFLREVLDFSGNFTRFAVRAAALHRSDEDLDTLQRLVETWQGLRNDPARQQELSNEINRQFIKATHNRVCVGLFNTLERISMKLFSLVEATVLDFDQKQKAYHHLIEALEERDPMMAEAAVSRYLRALEEHLAANEVTRGLFNGTLYT